MEKSIQTAMQKRRDVAREKRRQRTLKNKLDHLRIHGPKKFKSLASPSPYNGYRVYGPRIENNGRWYVNLNKHSLNKQFTISLARYVMEIGLGRRLLPSQHVDHIDGDAHNDQWTNLQVLSAKDNIAKGSSNGAFRSKWIEFNCPVCKKRVVRRNAHDFTEIRFNIRSCSRTCGRYLVALKRTLNTVKIKSYMNLKVITCIKHIEHQNIGERLTRKTKGMRRVHNFCMKKGVRIL